MLSISKDKLFYFVLIIIFGCSPKMGENDVVKIDRKVFNTDEFFADIVEALFSKLDVEQRTKAVTEYARRKIIQMEAEKRGIISDKEIQQRMIVVNDNLIVDTILEEEVWTPLISDSSLKILYKRLGTERNVHNLVLTYKGSQHSKSDRSEKQAYLLVSEIRDKIVSGEMKFFEAAKKYSEDPSRFSDGLLGSFKWGGLPEPLQTVSYSLKAGEISVPFKSKVGYHIIRVTGIRKLPQESFNDKKAELRLFMRSGKGHEFEIALKKFEKILGDTHHVTFNKRILKDILDEIHRNHNDERTPKATEIVDIDVSGIVCVADGEPYDVVWFQDRIEAMGPLLAQSLIFSEKSLKLTLEHVFYRYLTILFAKETRDDEWHGHIEHQGKRKKINILRKEVVFRLAEENPDISSEKILIQSLFESYKIRINKEFISSYSSPQESL